jgi:hypothetical protein
MGFFYGILFSMSLIINYIYKLKNEKTMKKSVLFITASLLTVTSLFAQRTSNLVIFAEDATPFFAIVNGIRQNIEPQTNVKITGLTNNANTVRVIFSNTAIPALSQNIYFQDMGVEATIKITNTKKGYKLRYFGEVPLESAPVDNSQWVSTFQVAEPTVNVNTNANSNAVVTTTVVEEVVTTTASGGTGNVNANVGTNGFGTTTSTNAGGTDENLNFNTNVSVNDGTGLNSNIGMNTQVSSTSTTTGTGENVSIGINMGGVGFNMNVNVNESGTGIGQNINYNETVSSTSSSNTVGVGNTAAVGTVSTTTTTTTTSTGSGFDNWNTGTTHQATTTAQTQYVEGYTGYIGCAMPQSKVDNIKTAIDNESFSSNKMQVAKQATKNKCLTTDQVIEIAEMFSFEDDKLEYVKYAYDFTYDRDNYYQVNSIFSFSATKDKLNAFLSTK